MDARLPKQRNVQQQNEQVERNIRNEATHWRSAGVPEALRALGLARGVEWERSIVIDLDIDYPGMPQLFGLLLAQDERFISFELDTDESHRILEAVSEWVDVSAQQNLSLRNRGTGAGRGALAIKVLHELNASLSD